MVEAAVIVALALVLGLGVATFGIFMVDGKGILVYGQ